MVYTYGHDSFNDEKPLPGRNALCSIEVLGNAGRDQARERTGKDGSRIQKCSSLYQLSPGIPRGQQVETTGKLFVY